MSEGFYIWVEGEDDELFVNQIIKTKLESKFDYIRVIQYSNESLQWRRDYLRNIKKMQADYIYIADLNSASCITYKRQTLQQQMPNLDLAKIIIVKPEIESWYYAGLDETAFQTLGIDKYNKFKTTDNLTKEDYQRSCPKSFNSDKAFKQEILKHYNLEIVLQQQTNQSLVYFLKKYTLR